MFSLTLAAIKCTERSGRSRNFLGAGDSDEAESVFGSNTDRPDFNMQFRYDFAQGNKNRFGSVQHLVLLRPCEALILLSDGFAEISIATATAAAELKLVIFFVMQIYHLA